MYAHKSLEAPALPALFPLARKIAVHGQVHPSIRPFFSMTTLIALEKPSKDHRPISGPQMLCNIIAATIIRSDRDALRDKLLPYNFGFGVSAGPEIVVHFLRLLRETQPDYGIMKVDVKNAYGEAQRSYVYSSLEKDFPAHVPFFLLTHNQPTMKRFWTTEGYQYLTVSDGLNQGGAESSAYFALTYLPVLQELKEKIPSVYVLANHDDTYLAGPTHDLAPAFHALQKIAKKRRNLTLQPIKSEAFHPSRAGWQPEGVPLRHDGLVVAGLPVGTHEFEEAHCTEKAQKIADAQLSSLDELNLPQHQLLLLRVLGSPKLVHFVRGVYPNRIIPAISLHDANILDSLAKIFLFDEPIPPNVVAQLRISLAQGGAGITDPVAIKEFAFLASVTKALKFLQEHHYDLWKAIEENYSASSELRLPFSKALHESFAVLRNLKNLALKEKILAPEEAAKIPLNISELMSCEVFKLQKFLSTINSKCLRYRLIRASDIEQRARLLSTMTRPSGAIFQAIPASPAFSLHPQAFIIIFRDHFGADLPFHMQNIRCDCKHAPPLTPNHLRTCKLNGGPIRVHNALRDVLHKCLWKAGITNEIEPFGIFDNGLRCDIRAAGFPGKSEHPEKPILCDVHVVDPQSGYCLPDSAFQPKFAAKKGEKMKNAKYLELSLAKGHFFFPLVMEVFGALGKPLLNLIGAAHSMFKGKDGSTWNPPADKTWATPTFMSYWLQRISVAVQKERARSILTLCRRLHVERFYGMEKWDLFPPSKV